MKVVKLYRVKMNSMGALPGRLPEGMIIGMDEAEEKALQGNTLVKDCFEQIQIHEDSIDWNLDDVLPPDDPGPTKEKI